MGNPDFLFKIQRCFHVRRYVKRKITSDEFPRILHVDSSDVECGRKIIWGGKGGRCLQLEQKPSLNLEFCSERNLESGKVETSLEF